MPEGTGTGNGDTGSTDGTKGEGNTSTTGDTNSGTQELEVSNLVKQFGQDAVDTMFKDRVGSATRKYSDYDEIVAERDKLKQGLMSDNEKAIQEATDKVKADVTAEFESHLKASAVQLAATDLLADPSDAVKFLDLGEINLTGKSIDADAVTAQLTKLVADKPYLAKNASSSNDSGSGDGGEQGGSEGPSLEDMSMDEYRKHRGLS